tara:strand:- start:144 stop:365 length:222 start_codon:yes stop_codon:yes gene_type:complete
VPQAQVAAVPVASAAHAVSEVSVAEAVVDDPLPYRAKTAAVTAKKMILGEDPQEAASPPVAAVPAPQAASTGE